MSGDMGRAVVAAVDGSESARLAAWWAAAEAARRRLPLRLVHAVRIAYTGAWVPSQGFVDGLVRRGNEMVTVVRAELAQRHRGLDVHTRVVLADPVPTLVAESEAAAMTVLGSRGLGGFSGLVVGSTAVGLVARGHGPVAVIRGGTPGASPPAEGPVVVGVDGSPASEGAIAAAFEAASLHSAELVAVHAWSEYVSDIEFAYARRFDLDSDAVEAHQRELLAERLAGWAEKYPDVTVRRVVTRDHPVRALLARSAEARLLVVGSRGRGGFTGMLLGSTSQALIYHATCPLLVVRPSH